MAEATYQSARPSESASDLFSSGVEQTQSMMSRASTLRQQRQTEEMNRQRIAENALLAPVHQAKAKADMVKLGTDLQVALRTQESRDGAYKLYDSATTDFDFINQVPDAEVRARLSREWLSRYSQLANIKELEPQVKQLSNLALNNINGSLVLAKMGSAEARAFEALTTGLNPEEKEKARRVKMGLEGRASNAGKKQGKLTLPDGSQVDVTFDPRTGENETPTLATPGGQAITDPKATAQFVGPSAESEAAMKEKGKQESERQAKLAQAKPKRQASLKQAEANTERLSSDIDELISKVSAATAGPGGTLLDKFPGTTARDLQSNLDSVKANIGFQTLQSMREASPTGGALGQVSDVENRLLQSVLGSLQIGQSPSQLISNLKKVKQRFTENYGITRAAFQNEFGEDSGAAEVQPVKEEKTVGKYRVIVH